MVNNSDGNLVVKGGVPMSPITSSHVVNVSLNSDHGGLEIGNSIPISFALMLKDKTVRKTIKLVELTNNEVVQVSLKNFFDALTKENKIYESTNDTWKTSTVDDESIGHESDSEVEENIVVEQPMFMGGRTKPNAPTTKTPMKTGI
ncbi:hypothetical protein Tco_0670184 [Tanacetum coccineum]